MEIDLNFEDEELVYFVTKWKDIAQNKKENEYDGYLKNAGIEFRYKDVWYKLYPNDIGAL